jgi:hypothetical protein
MAVSETVLILAAGTLVLAILIAARLTTRALVDGGKASATGGSGPTDVAGVIALPPLNFLRFLVVQRFSKWQSRFPSLPDMESFAIWLVHFSQQAALL